MGEIITFYSYKGGVGRTMTLTNIAVLLSQWGYKVLVIDWDLEAPGLEFFFKGYLDILEVSQKEGIIDLLYHSSSNHPDFLSWQDFVFEIVIPKGAAPLHLLTAGKKDKGYFAKVRSLDLHHFYSEKNGGLYIETLRNSWKQSYDFVLVDSRTGITDIGGICTVQLPDILALLFTATEQSLEGIIDVAKKVNSAREELPFDRFSLLYLPIPSRFDAGEEFKLSQYWLQKFTNELTPIYSFWLPQKINKRDFIEITKIPYVAYFSFGEKLPVIEQGTTDPQSIGFAYETLATLIAGKMENADQLLENRNQAIRKVVKIEQNMPKVPILTLDDLAPGTLLENGRFEIVDLVNSTNHSRTFKAWDKLIDIPVAIKFPNVDGVSVEVARVMQENIIQEAKILTSLNHPNIGKISSTIAHPVGIVLKWHEGPSLQYLLDHDERPSTLEIIEIGIKLADSLNYLHKNAIIHRDIKPQNIILAGATEPILFDFSIAKSQSVESVILSESVSQGFVGTKFYSAPEQFYLSDIGPPADIFALGLVLYELLTRSHPYKFGNLPSLYEEGYLPTPQRFNIPTSLYKILCSMLNEKPEKRLSAQNLKEALINLVENLKDDQSLLTEPDEKKHKIGGKIIYGQKPIFELPDRRSLPEYEVANFLKDNLNPREVGDFRIIVNYSLNLPDLFRVVEVDIVVINRFGCFLLEVKSLKGDIKAYDDRWLLSMGRSINNPFATMNIKTRAVKQTIFEMPKFSNLRNINVCGLVVLPSGNQNVSNYSNYDSEAIVDLDSLLKAISSGKNKSRELRDSEIEAIFDKLYRWQSVEREDIVGNYRITGELLPGDLYDAYKAEDILLSSRIVRIKRYQLSSLIQENDALRIFQRSIEAFTRLGFHPNILATLNFFADPESPDVFYEVTELPEGDRLDVFISKQVEPLPFELQLDYIKQICDALKFAHDFEQPGKRKSPIYHRNLKPETIFVTATNTIKLADFDFAKIANKETVTNLINDSNASRFTAPELLLSPSSAGPYSDIFSLGAVWFCLAGLPEKNTLITDENVEKLSLPPKALELLKKMLSKAPMKRPQSVENVLDVLNLLKPD